MVPKGGEGVGHTACCERGAGPARGRQGSGSKVWVGGWVGPIGRVPALRGPNRCGKGRVTFFLYFTLAVTRSLLSSAARSSRVKALPLRRRLLRSASSFVLTYASTLPLNLAWTACSRLVTSTNRRRSACAPWRRVCGEARVAAEASSVVAGEQPATKRRVFRVVRRARRAYPRRLATRAAQPTLPRRQPTQPQVKGRTHRTLFTDGGNAQ